MATKTPAKAGKTKAPFLPGSIIWQKKGPLPIWAWALIALGLLFVVTWWRRNKNAAAESTEADTGNVPTGNNQGVPVFVVPQAPVSPVTVLPPPPPVVVPPVTVPPAPPGGGAPPPLAPPYFLEAPTNQNLYDWMSSMNQQHPGLDTSFARVDVLNPGWRTKDGNLQWFKDPAGTNNKIPKFMKHTVVLKVRS